MYICIYIYIYTQTRISTLNYKSTIFCKLSSFGGGPVHGAPSDGRGGTTISLSFQFAVFSNIQCIYFKIFKGKFNIYLIILESILNPESSEPPADRSCRMGHGRPETVCSRKGATTNDIQYNLKTYTHILMIIAITLLLLFLLLIIMTGSRWLSDGRLDIVRAAQARAYDDMA